MNKETRKFATHLFRQIAKHYDVSRIEMQSERRYQEIVKYSSFLVLI